MTESSERRRGGGRRRFLGIEGGGTTWVVAVAIVDEDGAPLGVSCVCHREEFATTTPEETLGNIRRWIEEHASDVDAIGVATFGPVDVRVDRQSYGFITTTPKPNWANVDVLGALFGDGNDAWVSRARLQTPKTNIPIGFDTDVNAPAIAEYDRFKREGETMKTSCCYVTVGTGVGVGIVANGAPVHGILHPEAGHVHVQGMLNDGFCGTCPFHGNCVEGMVSSGALAARRGVTARELKDLGDDDEVWNACAHYLAGLCVTLSLTLSPERIVLGGGIMQRAILFDKIRALVPKLLAGYMSLDELTTARGLENYIVPSNSGNNAGLIGALTLAQTALTLM